MKVILTLELRAPDNRVAKAIYEALAPDNVDFPEGLSLTMRQKGNILELKFSSISKIDTLISTVDDVFEACGVGLRGLSVVAGVAH